MATKHDIDEAVKYLLANIDSVENPSMEMLATLLSKLIFIFGKQGAPKIIGATNDLATTKPAKRIISFEPSDPTRTHPAILALEKVFSVSPTPTNPEEIINPLVIALQNLYTALANNEINALNFDYKNTTKLLDVCLLVTKKLYDKNGTWHPMNLVNACNDQLPVPPHIEG